MAQWVKCLPYSHMVWAWSLQINTKPDTAALEGRWEMKTEGSQEAQALASPEVFPNKQPQTLPQTMWKARTTTRRCLLTSTLWHSTWAPPPTGTHRYSWQYIYNESILVELLPDTEHMEHLTFSWGSVPSEHHNTIQSYCNLPRSQKGWLVCYVYTETSQRVTFCSSAIDFNSSWSKFMGKEKV